MASNRRPAADDGLVPAVLCDVTSITAPHCLPLQTRPQAVVFDFDGLMFNTEELYSEVDVELLRRRGRELTPELRARMLGLPAAVALQTMIDAYRLTETTEDLLSESDEVLRDLLRTRLAPMPGLLDLLTVVAQLHLPSAIATNSPRAFVEQVLIRYELNARFRFVLASEDIVQPKPHPEIYLRAAQRLDVRPSTMLVLEDSPRGTTAALAAGAITVAVPGPHNRTCDFGPVAAVVEALGSKRINQLLGAG